MRGIAEAKRGLQHRLGQRRVGVRGPRQVVRGRARLHRQRPLRDQVGDVRSQQVDPEDATTPGLANQPDHAVGFTEDARTRVGRERKLRDLDFRALSARLSFGQAHAGDLRPGEDDVGHGTIIDLPLAAGCILGGDAAIHHRLVRQHPPADCVANGPDVGQIRRQPFVHGDRPAVHAQAQFSETHPLRVRPTTGRHQDPLAVRRRLSTGRFREHAQRLADSLDPLDDRAGPDLHAPAAQQQMQPFRDGFIGCARENRRGHLQDGYLAAQRLVNARELQPDHTAPDHDQPGGHRLDVQRSGARDHARQVASRNGRRRGDRTGREDDPLRRNLPSASLCHHQSRACPA